MIGPMARSISDDEFEEKMKRVSIPEQVTKWRNARAGFPQEVLDEEMRKVRVSIARLEARLGESPWLAGPDYTLADICNFAIARRSLSAAADVTNWSCHRRLASSTTLSRAELSRIGRHAADARWRAFRSAQSAYTNGYA